MSFIRNCRDWFAGKRFNRDEPAFRDGDRNFVRQFSPRGKDENGAQESRHIELLYQASAQVNDLVMHEDKHNWAKFYSYIYLCAGLLAAVAFTLRSDDVAVKVGFSILLAIAGSGISFGFQHMLDSSIGCLENHKKHLVMIDRRLRDDHGMPVIICNREGPRRWLLLSAPRLGILVWLAVGTVVTWGTLSSTPQSGGIAGAADCTQCATHSGTPDSEQ